MLVNMNGVVTKDGPCIPQFNINNLEFARYILEECQELNCPVILGVSESAIKYMGGAKVVVTMVDELTKALSISIPVVIHLDHGQSVEICKTAIDAGFTSVMIDASKERLKDNIKITKEVVKYAHDNGVTVEGEVGGIGGTEDGVADSMRFAEVEDCVKYVKETDIDLLAPALGSVHGLYKGEPNLQYDRMEELRTKVDVPLVLHGGSGLRDIDITKAIKCGTRKVNIDTELRMAWSSAVREKLREDKEMYDPRKIIGSGEAKIKEVVRKKIELYNK